MTAESPKQYKCRNYNRTKKWMVINAHNPEEAAETYAEIARTELPDEVTIMNFGNYKVYQEIIYHATKCGG